jgi:lysophospholipase L1-like esterase
MAYAPGVKKNLKKRAEIIIIKENCEDSAKIVRNLEKWLKQAQSPEIAIVHFNCGLHDLKRPFGATQNQQPLPMYEENLRKIVIRLQQIPGVRLIWATTTPVIYSRHHAKKGFDRFEEDVSLYNSAANRIMEEFHIPINDLNRVITENGVEKSLRDDGVHMLPSANRLLVDAVTIKLKEVLGNSDSKS